jgi:Fic family protein
LIKPSKCGVFREKSLVHIQGNPDLIFPPGGAVKGLLKEYCEEFPTPSRMAVSGDVLIQAAKASHRFVRIHPYADGNGRVSRLLMNLVLWGVYQPVCIKADKKGRHRYSQALRRADRGSYEPLAALIALSLIEVYDRLLASVSK